ncbi:SDR family oxidoreductase [Aquirufa nivalisilvae]|uniref:SDR family oxidoreductase n=1 Tax=Aquirufa nivalisilvae TaxID=2516557 RepID=UPI001032DAE6|nr:SDR family oxidoreductase [Aquirufa nivalisilvae]MCZ2480184.1 SDR family oxidoreductase [Aquirufa nivalisilvae]MCZ2482421.1 SDR family oxidoreductase [Aquirufa nivalisilvae]TBH73804.1 SDR family oxidoreductase [Aquirufa nivalisilvae]
MNLGLKEKVIIVTGGAKGIGEGISQSLALESAMVAIVGRNKEDNEKAIAKIQATGGQAFSFVAELSRPEECERVVNEVYQFFGRIDGLVNNAGINDGVGLASGSYEKFMQSLHSNLIHYYLMAKACLPHLIQSKGAIVNIGSKVAETGQGGTSAYAAANGGRNALTREWAVELLKEGVRVNAVIVAECYTPLYDRWLKTLPNPEETLASITEKIPLGKRMTTPEELGDMVTFLMSKKSSHTTGQLIHVDGGYTHLDRALI